MVSVASSLVFFVELDERVLLAASVESAKVCTFKSGVTFAAEIPILDLSREAVTPSLDFPLAKPTVKLDGKVALRTASAVAPAVPVAELVDVLAVLAEVASSLGNDCNPSVAVDEDD